MGLRHANLKSMPFKMLVVLRSNVLDWPLKSFIGMLNFYSKFLPNLQSKLHPLYELMTKNAKFIWSQERENVFIECKKLVCNSPILAFYDPSKSLNIVCDASRRSVECCR